MLLTIGACTPENAEYWAVDALWFQVEEDSKAHGFHNWQIYDAQWGKKQSPEFHVCALVREWDANSITPCENCISSWSMHNENIETDCDEHILDQFDVTFLHSFGLSTELGQLPASPQPSSATMGVWIETADNKPWEAYGWAWKTKDFTYQIQTPWAWALRP